jgi:hypothetical protein
MTITGFDMVSRDLLGGWGIYYLNYNDSIDIHESGT